MRLGHGCVGRAAGCKGTCHTHRDPHSHGSSRDANPAACGVSARAPLWSLHPLSTRSSRQGGGHPSSPAGGTHGHPGDSSAQETRLIYRPLSVTKTLLRSQGVHVTLGHNTHLGPSGHVRTFWPFRAWLTPCSSPEISCCPGSLVPLTGDDLGQDGDVGTGGTRPPQPTARKCVHTGTTNLHV